MTDTMLIYKIILCVIVFAVSLGAAAYMTWGERKLAAWLQDRVGPNRAGPLGLLQPIADGIKMIFKEEMIPTHSNRWLFILGPSFFMLCACMTGVVIPWGAGWQVGDVTYPMQVTDINIGLLYLLSVVSIGVYGVMIGGWASNNKFALLGALRASSQMISYELAMGVSAITIVLLSGSLSLNDIVNGQQDVWNIFYQPVAFLIFFICALAELNRAPFDLPECESELVGGYHTEYSSMKLGLYLFSEYTSMFVSSAIMSILFFGGYNFPGMSHFSGNTLAILGIAAFAIKIFIFIFVIMWIRWTIPRFRFDQLMHLGWKSLLPLSLINLLITGIVIAYQNGWF